MRAGSPIFSYQNYMTLYTKLSDALQAAFDRFDATRKAGRVIPFPAGNKKAI